MITRVPRQKSTYHTNRSAYICVIRCIRNIFAVIRSVSFINQTHHSLVLGHTRLGSSLRMHWSTLVDARLKHGSSLYRFTCGFLSSLEFDFLTSRRWLQLWVLHTLLNRAKDLGQSSPSFQNHRPPTVLPSADGKGQLGQISSHL